MCKSTLEKYAELSVNLDIMEIEGEKEIEIARRKKLF